MGANNLTKAQVIEDLGERLNGRVNKTVISAVFDAIADQIVEHTSAGATYPLGRLGKFSITEVGQRVGRNPQTGEQVIVPPHHRLKFKPSEATKRRLSTLDN